MNSVQLLEYLIVGVNLFLLVVFLAWRFCGPGRPQCREIVQESGATQETERH